MILWWTKYGIPQSYTMTTPAMPPNEQVAPSFIIVDGYALHRWVRTTDDAAFYEPVKAVKHIVNGQDADELATAAVKSVMDRPLPSHIGQPLYPSGMLELPWSWLFGGSIMLVIIVIIVVVFAVLS